MAPSRKVKIIGGTSAAVLALGAGTAFAQNGTPATEVDLDDVVPISEVSAPTGDSVNLADLTFQLDDHDSVASPFDADDAETAEDESPDESPDDSPDESPDDSPDESPDDSPDESPDESPDVSPESESPDDSPDDSPDESPDDSPDESPDDSPDESPDDSPDESPDDSPDESPESPDNADTSD